MKMKEDQQSSQKIRKKDKINNCSNNSSNNNDKIIIKVPAAMYAKDIGISFHANTCVIKKIAPNSFVHKNYGSFVVGYKVCNIDTIVPKTDKECRIVLDKVRKKGKPFQIILNGKLKNEKMLSDENKDEKVIIIGTKVNIDTSELSDKLKEATLAIESNDIIDGEKVTKAEKSIKLEEKDQSMEIDRKEIEHKAQREAEEKEKLRIQKEEEELKAKLNGKIRVIYEMYDEEFYIKNGQLSSEEIDEEFAISFAMPGSHMYLSDISPKERTELENGPNPDETVPPYYSSSSGNIFTNMETNEVYYCIVIQDKEQFLKDQSKFQRVAKNMMTEEKSLSLKNDDGRGFETCSCIYGNPCVDEYGCRDWYNRYAIAKKNGWKGF